MDDVVNIHTNRHELLSIEMGRWRCIGGLIRVSKIEGCVVVVIRLG